MSAHVRQVSQLALEAIARRLAVAEIHIEPAPEVSTPKNAQISKGVLDRITEKLVRQEIVVEGNAEVKLPPHVTSSPEVHVVTPGGEEELPVAVREFDQLRSFSHSQGECPLKARTGSG
jgi:hypothetical protein